MSNATTHIETEKRSAERSRSKLVPELRFKEFEVDWKIENLGSVGSIVNGLTYSPDDINPEGVLVLRSSNVQNGMLYLEDNVYVIAEKFNPVFVDDILICVRNGSKRLIGKNTLITENVKGVAFGAFMAIYRSDFNRFLYYFFSSEQYYKEIHKNLGATINSINGSDLRKFKVGFPSLPEQQKIASFLSTIDEKIQQLTKKKELLEQYKKGVMQQLFPSTGSGQRSGQLRFKDENGKTYPDWEEKRLGEIAEIVGGGTPETVKPDYWDGEIQWFTPTEIRSKYISNSKRTITQSGLSKSSAKLLPAGTILFTSRATIAELGFATQECSTNQGFQSLIVNQNNNSEFIYQLIKVNKNEFVKKSQGSTFLEISSKEMKKMKFNTPILEEQQKIATYLSGIDTKIESVTNQITQTQTFKKGLLQQMFV